MFVCIFCALDAELVQEGYLIVSDTTRWKLRLAAYRRVEMVHFSEAGLLGFQQHSSSQLPTSMPVCFFVVCPLLDDRVGKASYRPLMEMTRGILLNRLSGLFSM